MEQLHEGRLFGTNGDRVVVEQELWKQVTGPARGDALVATVETIDDRHRTGGPCIGCGDWMPRDELNEGYCVDCYTPETNDWDGTCKGEEWYADLGD